MLLFANIFFSILQGKGNMKTMLEPNYRPSEDEEYMNPTQLEYFKQKLLALREEVHDESGSILSYLPEENWHEPDFNDRVTIDLGAAFVLRKGDRKRKYLDKINQALQRIEENEYGYCKETGDKIGLKRLEARPTAEYTIEAQEKHELYEKQHNEDD
jgi:DnaK suppressor protein